MEAEKEEDGFYFFLQKWGEFKLTHSRSLTFGWSITLFCQLWEELPLNLALTFMVPGDEARWLGDISSSAIVRMTFLLFVSEMSPHLRDGLVVFWLDIHSWTMNLKDLGDLLTFSLAPREVHISGVELKTSGAGKLFSQNFGLWPNTKCKPSVMSPIVDCRFKALSLALCPSPSWFVGARMRRAADRISKDTNLRVVCFYSNN